MNVVDRIGEALGIQTDTVWRIAGTIVVTLLWIGIGRLRRRLLARTMDDPKVTPVLWTTVVESGVRLTMRYLCKPRARRSSETHIWEQVLDAMAATPNVDFAYPTTRRFDNMNEGKPAVRAVLTPRANPSTTRD